ncbi:uncharacterized protein MYCGRDRAFT_95410 [Zymoseptoria tritici IPO323]|uniref:Uncharacterized protein n=1 Tax=Zymoseptoria tritici (strain CBS 115943 / IPO323) TaxID=336722 RepID=F9XH26_ZYMTI|nr:uncharacterized protein MYCGRDRAFT_95410 [Zymoseptoria tritici IPO323]EGP85140.1 hypothetical protein MYCGRDRAFT_95410 [Zymoseptoria tritici IPO323]
MNTRLRSEVGGGLSGPSLASPYQPEAERAELAEPSQNSPFEISAQDLFDPRYNQQWHASSDDPPLQAIVQDARPQLQVGNHDQDVFELLLDPQLFGLHEPVEYLENPQPQLSNPVVDHNASEFTAIDPRWLTIALPTAFAGSQFECFSIRLLEATALAD